MFYGRFLVPRIYCLLNKDHRRWNKLTGMATKARAYQLGSISLVNNTNKDCPASTLTLSQAVGQAVSRVIKEGKVPPEVWQDMLRRQKLGDESLRSTMPMSGPIH